MRGIAVWLVRKEYYACVLGYFLGTFATTDSRGWYAIDRIQEPGRAYVVMAKASFKPGSEAATDPKLRKTVLTPAYYPGSEFAETAVPVATRAGERIEGVDIRVKQSPAYCIDGALDIGGKPSPHSFEITGEQPPASGPGYYTFYPSLQSGPRGEFRVCNLHPGGYRIAIPSFTTGSRDGPRYSASTIVTVRDEDIHDFNVHAELETPLPGLVVWDGEAPMKSVDAKLRVQLLPLATRDGFSASASVPGDFSFPGVPMEEYMVRAIGLPAGLYVKDIAYGGLSVLYDAMRYGSAAASAGLRVVVARDGGFIGVKVADKDGNPVSEAWVYAMPASAPTPRVLSAVLVSGRTNQDGNFLTGTLAPGKYYVLAREAEIYPTPESMDSLWRARLHAKEVDIGPNATAQVTLAPCQDRVWQQSGPNRCAPRRPRWHGGARRRGRK